MSLYGNNYTVDGVPCGIITRGSANGKYQAVFEREYASLEAIEGINWNQPQVEGDSVLPVGCGFTVEDISYSAATHSYTVTLQVSEQFLGDVAGFQAQVDELTSTVQAQAETIQALEQAGTAAQVEEQLEAAYQEGVESNG